MKRFFIFSRTIFFVLFLSLPLNVFSQQLEITENDQLYLQLINNVFIFVENNYVDQVDSKVLYEGALKGMLEALEDPYSTYLDSDMMTSMSDTTEGTFGGVGLTISKRYVSTPDEPAYVEVVSPIEDTPGWKAGILPGDKLTKINGISTPDITMEEVLAMLRGEIGKPVEVTVLRGNSLEFTTTLIRDLIEVPIDENLTIIDTPGLLDEGSIILNVDGKTLNKILPKKEIKPIVIQIKVNQTILIDNLVRLDVQKGSSLIFYLSNDLKIERYYKNIDKLATLENQNIIVPNNSDIVIKGMGFIKVTKQTPIKIYLPHDVKFSIRSSII